MGVEAVCREKQKLMVTCSARWKPTAAAQAKRIPRSSSASNSDVDVESPLDIDAMSAHFSRRGVDYVPFFVSALQQLADRLHGLLRTDCLRLHAQAVEAARLNT